MVEHTSLRTYMFMFDFCKDCVLLYELKIHIVSLLAIQLRPCMCKYVLV